MAAVREMHARPLGRVAAAPGEVSIHGVPRPLLRLLDAIPDREQKTAADLGCGSGMLLPRLAERFGRVLGIDCSPALLSRARATCRARHVSLHRADMADLTPFRGRFDVAVVMNAVLTPDDERLDRVFESLHSAMRPGGLLIGLFPAIKAIVYRGFLVHERERRRADDERPRLGTNDVEEPAALDVSRKALVTDSDRGQKFFYAFEMRHRLHRVGFRRLRLTRAVHTAAARAGHPPIWDWLLRAEAR